MSTDPNAGDLFSRLKAHFHNEKELAAPERLAQEIDNFYKNNLINAHEHDMMEGIVSFQTKMAREVMVPRTDAFMVDINRDFQKNLVEILKKPYSRIPVYDGERDKIVGVIHIRTVLRKAWENGFDKINYEDVMFEPLFAPETINLGELLVEIQQSQRQLVILTDEFGGVVGIATIEDIIEEIVGDIDDEADQAQVLYKQVDQQHYIIYGKMLLTDFNEKFGTDLEMEDVDTIAGYVITKLGLIPAKGEKLNVKLANGMILTTRKMKGSRLLTLLLSIPDQDKNINENKVG
ncbi:putative hemolysin [Lactobacillus colini]|uniref:Hemolysin n=1 Tax=Lactobacillus colini TaxID=1819254 RepID=A0ABS4MD38_9LACO|nr:hemolysin family protein [Lactobacillus colini]MBP2057605.1 putative hemolysin [Lactobacillus colini]